MLRGMEIRYSKTRFCDGCDSRIGRKSGLDYANDARGMECRTAPILKYRSCRGEKEQPRKAAATSKGSDILILGAFRIPFLSHHWRNPNHFSSRSLSRIHRKNVSSNTESPSPSTYTV